MRGGGGVQGANCIFIGKKTPVSEPGQFKPMFKGRLYLRVVIETIQSCNIVFWSVLEHSSHEDT